MNNFEHFKDLYTRLKGNELSYNSESEIITISSDDTSNIEAVLSDFTKIHGGIEFSVNTFNYVLFFDENEFSEKWKKAIAPDRDIAILNTNAKNKFYSCGTKSYYLDFDLSNSFFFKNIFTYNYFIDFFKTKSADEFNKFQFVDSFDINSRKLFFTSSKEPGKLVISYPSDLPEFNVEYDNFNNFERLKESFEPANKNLPIFIKNEIFKYFNDKNNEDGFVALFKNLKQILDLADKNYQIYLHDLSLDKIKTDYKEYKQKYFTSQNDILTKITTQVVALPISIAASAFSLYNLKGELFPTLIVIFGLIGYIIYVTFILNIYFSDINNLNKLAQKDYSILKAHSFFLANKSELIFFNDIKNDLFNRLKSLKTGLNIFTFIMWISSTLLIFFSIKMLGIKLGNLIFLFLFITFLFCYVYMNYLNKDVLKNEEMAD